VNTIDISCSDDLLSWHVRESEVWIHLA
jgi:hypothetical protein